MEVIQSLADQVAYTVWANQLILDAVEKLEGEKFLRPMGSSFASVRDTLVHAMWAEWTWLERWEGRSPRAVLEPTDFPTLASIRERWKEIEVRRAALVGRLGSGEDERRISYVNRRGERWEYTLGRMMQHVVIHSAYHRGQVVTLLRQLGASAPTTDYLVFWDTRTASAD